MIRDLAADIQTLSSGLGILVLLGLISAWAWTLVIVLFLDLRAVLGKGGGQGASDNASGTMAEYAAFCRGVFSRGLSPHLAQWAIRVRGDGILQSLAGNVSTILLLASLAPLLGLLGTVDGMIDTFQALAQPGTAGSEALTMGISKALITTQGGLLVAIPSLLAGGILHRKTRKLGDALRIAALQAGDRRHEAELQGGNR